MIHWSFIFAAAALKRHADVTVFAERRLSKPAIVEIDATIQNDDKVIDTWAVYREADASRSARSLTHHATRDSKSSSRSVETNPKGGIRLNKPRRLLKQAILMNLLTSSANTCSRELLFRLASGAASAQWHSLWFVGRFLWGGLFLFLVFEFHELCGFLSSWMSLAFVASTRSVGKLVSGSDSQSVGVT